MGTPLQTLYTRFQTKLDEDLTGKESLIFALVDVAISKSDKNCTHDLTYALTDPEAEEQTYDGSFDEILNNDEIELLALWMKYEWKNRKVSKLENQKQEIGTSDFNRLENKANLLKELRLGVKDTLDEINSLKNDMNTYQYK